MNKQSIQELSSYISEQYGVDCTHHGTMESNAFVALWNHDRSRCVATFETIEQFVELLNVATVLVERQDDISHTQWYRQNFSDDIDK